MFAHPARIAPRRMRQHESIRRVFAPVRDDIAQPPLQAQMARDCVRTDDDTQLRATDLLQALCVPSFPAYGRWRQVRAFRIIARKAKGCGQDRDQIAVVKLVVIQPKPIAQPVTRAVPASRALGLQSRLACSRETRQLGADGGQSLSQQSVPHKSGRLLCHLAASWPFHFHAILQ